MEKKPNTQYKKFKETARALGWDESEEAFNAKLKKLAKAKPEHIKPKQGRKRNG